MPRKITREEFLKLLALSSGGLVLGRLLSACGVLQEAAAPAPSLTPAPNMPLPTATPLEALDVVRVHGGDPEVMVRKALEAFGGMQAFVPPGASVVIKPNICVAYHTYESAATTNPWVVGALVRLCLEAGAQTVKVFDFPFGGSAQAAYAKSGIQEQVEAAGGQMEIMTNLKYAPTEIPGGLRLKRTSAYQEALKTDVLIDVPIAKHHGSTRLTLGMKNLMGLVQDRSALHSKGLGQCIADLTSLFRPKLTVVDAVRILTANGPTGGSLKDVKQLDTLIVSPDIVAADSVACSLFGMKPEEIAYIPAASAMGLGNSDLTRMKIKEIELSA